MRPRWIRADNPGPFTLDGTRTYLVGRQRVAVIDPGPDLGPHVEAIVQALAGAHSAVVLVTHGHGDHAGAVDRLAGLLRGTLGGEVPVLGAGHPRARPPPRGGVETDVGVLRTIPTPGHTPDHLAFLWPAARALFAGDHLLGEGDTTWVAEYAGCVADYLGSLARLRGLDLDVVYPGHGPPLTDPVRALDRFERHRRDRIEAVRRVLSARPALDDEALYGAVYGDTVPPGLEEAARRSLAAVREYVDTGGGGGVSSTP